MNRGAVVGRLKKKVNDNRIPNAWPYKEDLLKEIRDAKEKMEEVKLKQKEKRKEEVQKRRLGISMDVEIDETTTNQLLATSTEEQEDDEEEESIKVKDGLGQNSRRAYLSILRKVVKGADVIIQVLDARDPEGTRSTSVEDIVLSMPGKRLVYVLNKADLVPKEALAGWLKYLRQSYPTVPFKCNTQNQKGNLSMMTGKVSKQKESGLKTSVAVGAEELLGLLKNYSRVGDGTSNKSIITVGIVGFPNVGKSSLINSLMRSRAVGVSSVPGFTKSSQEVILDRNIRLIDSPGVVFADGDSAATALRNCVNVEDLDDVLTPIQAILDKCPPAYLMQVYSISKFSSTDCVSFLSLVAKAMGKLKKGGIPNTTAAAKVVLHDWNSGKIKYYCNPPKIKKSSRKNEQESKIVDVFGKGFDVNAGEAQVINDELEFNENEDEFFIPVENVGDSLETEMTVDN